MELELEGSKICVAVVALLLNHSEMLNKSLEPGTCSVFPP